MKFYSYIDITTKMTLSIYKKKLGSWAVRWSRGWVVGEGDSLFLTAKRRRGWVVVWLGVWGRSQKSHYYSNRLSSHFLQKGTLTYQGKPGDHQISTGVSCALVWQTTQGQISNWDAAGKNFVRIVFNTEYIPIHLARGDAEGAKTGLFCPS
jgi:hypothetical protein